VQGVDGREEHTERESKGEEKSSVGNVEGIRKRKKRRGEEEHGRKKKALRGCPELIYDHSR
jgi:hypothetical protein